MSAEGRLLGVYRIGQLLGRGGMGEVYRGRDTRLARDVAIKVLPADVSLDPDRLARFDREARVLASLNHPHIAAIYGLEESGGLRGLVLELVDGETLAARLARGAIPVTDALRLARDIADALEAAHDQGIVHRDLKPANVKLTDSGEVKLLDFGLAKVMGGDSSTETVLPVTQPGMVLGTTSYMSPEQARGAEADKRTDIWAFGCVLFEMLTGTPAFAGSSTFDILAAVATGSPDFAALPAATPSGVRRLLERCLRKEPKQRLRDIGDARLEIESALAEPSSTVGQTSGSRSWPVASVAIALLAAAAGGALTWMGMRTSSAEAGSDRPIAFAIDPPEGVAWGELPPDPQPAVSPDGEKVAFVGRSASGTGLWVRRLEDVTSALLPNSADISDNAVALGTIGLAWSPDSTRLVYCVRGRLKIHSLDSRPVALVEADCRNGQVSWSPGGEILYSTSDGLSRIPAEGGTASRVTESSPGETHLHPWWLPDGRRFLYTVVPPENKASGIYTGDIDGGAPRRLAPDVSKAEYVAAPDGRGFLVFVRGVTLVAQQVDPASLAAVGDPRVVAAAMWNGPGALPSFSSSPTLLVHRSGVAAREAGWALVDRQGRALGPRYGAPRAGGGAALSPDDATLVYARRSLDTLQLQLWTVDLARGVEQPLSAAALAAPATDNPEFSRDGRRLAFQGIQDGGVRLFTMDFPNGEARRIATKTPSGLFRPDWSSDGSTLVVTTGRGSIVTIAENDAGDPRVVVENAVQPSLSPDGAWLAYTAMPPDGSPQVWVQRFPGGGDRTRVSPEGGFQPRWRADGRELFYLAPDGALMAAGVPFAASAPSLLFRERFRSEGAGALQREYLPFRDGQRFLVNLRTTGPVPLTAVRNWLQAGMP